MPKKNLAKSITIYKREKSDRCYVRMPHAKNDLFINYDSIPRPFNFVLSFYGNVTIPRIWTPPLGDTIFPRLKKLQDDPELRGSIEYKMLKDLGDYAGDGTNSIPLDDHHFRQIFLSALKFIRRDCHAASFGEDDPEMSTNTENGGSPSR